jgi:hypothetical protein
LNLSPVQKIKALSKSRKVTAIIPDEAVTLACWFPKNAPAGDPDIDTDCFGDDRGGHLAGNVVAAQRRFPSPGICKKMGK